MADDHSSFAARRTSRAFFHGTFQPGRLAGSLDAGSLDVALEGAATAAAELEGTVPALLSPDEAGSAFRTTRESAAVIEADLHGAVPDQLCDETGRCSGRREDPDLTSRPGQGDVEEPAVARRSG